MKPIGTINYSELSKRLSSTALVHFNANDSFVISRIDSQSLFSAGRFDLGVKTFLAECLMEERELNFARDSYLAHLAVWNGLFEITSRKYGAEQYLEKFAALVSARSEINFNSMLLPVDQNMTLIDGAHRCSVAAITDQIVQVVRSKGTSNSYDYQFFAKCFEEVMPQQARLLSDLMAFYFCKYRKSARCICIMPSTDGQYADEIEEKIQRQSKIFYKRNLRCTSKYFETLILHLYMHDPNRWVGSFDAGFHGCRDKAQRCYHPDQDLAIYFVEDLPEASSRTLKEEIRGLFPLANDSCHVNDSHEETMRLAGFVLNPATQIQEQVDLYSKFAKLERSFNILTRFVADSGISSERFCIGGSALLALFGKRDCSDFDLILDRGFDKFALPVGLGNHLNQMAFYPATAEQLIYDPYYHFYFLGFKFLRPEVVLSFKRARGESPKDTTDILNLLTIFPNLDLENGPRIDNDEVASAACKVIERCLRSQESTISRYSNTIRDWYLPEISRLEARVRAMQSEVDARFQQAEIDRQQIVLLEQAVSKTAKASNDT